MSGFPSLSSYDEARKHFDSVKPWESKYNPDYERPIGARNIKLDHYEERFNKAMRMVDDDIIFRLYAQDCVIWHPDNSVTVHGHPTMSTTAFVNGLVPDGVTHCKGRKDCDEPVLSLRAAESPKWLDDESWEQHRPRWQAYWNSGSIIQCSGPVRLHYNAETERWEPRDWDDLYPFHVPVVDRKLAREASMRYNLATLARVCSAVQTLANLPGAVEGHRGYQFGAMMDALEREAYIEAITLMPRGQVVVRHRRYGTPDGIEPGFLKKLRTHIYEHEGAVTRVEKRVLTPAAYRKYVADSNRFD
jgi:hypothetical protein